ncbi:hypothetical protein V8G54_029671 [Vigna mungo]|uniref:Non-haem dioxygenase N-terminal domain-containing protein n=1 Tax=Vigna mungo TaxID=3915 RepID=A0AAQ3MUQ3_VIGMU
MCIFLYTVESVKVDFKVNGKKEDGSKGDQLALNVFEEEKKEGPRVPTIDLREIDSLSEVVRGKCREKLKKAAVEWGVMNLVNHNIPEELLNRCGKQGKPSSLFQSRRRRSTRTIKPLGRFRGMEASLPTMPVGNWSGKITSSTLFILKKNTTSPSGQPN